MDLVQLVSFGCGVDAITTDEVREILRGRAASSTPSSKIDEITNLGAVKHPPAQPVCRTGREGSASKHGSTWNDMTAPNFTKEMKKTYTILIPNMAADPFPAYAKRPAQLHGYQTSSCWRN